MIKKRNHVKTIVISVIWALTLLVPLLSLAVENRKSPKDADVYTLYSTNYPQSSRRSGVATFDLGTEPFGADIFNRVMCERAADLYQADFEKLKASSRYDGTTKMRYWCEQGRFRR